MVKKLLFSIAAILLILTSIFPFVNSNHNEHKEDEFNSLKKEITEEKLSHGQYSCCLERPCASCLSLSPWHGEGTSCFCLDDVMNGQAPCSECVGGILAGRGNPLIAEYFAQAIAESTGEKEAIERIIEEKYDIPVSEQI